MIKQPISSSYILPGWFNKFIDIIFMFSHFSSNGKGFGSYRDVIYYNVQLENVIFFILHYDNLLHKKVGRRMHVNSFSSPM